MIGAKVLSTPYAWVREPPNLSAGTACDEESHGTLRPIR
jgi:hypothetical protein